MHPTRTFLHIHGHILAHSAHILAHSLLRVCVCVCVCIARRAWWTVYRRAWWTVYTNTPQLHTCGDNQILVVLHEHGIGIRPDSLSSCEGRLASSPGHSHLARRKGRGPGIKRHVINITGMKGGRRVKLSVGDIQDGQVAATAQQRANRFV